MPVDIVFGNNLLIVGFRNLQLPPNIKSGKIFGFDTESSLASVGSIVKFIEIFSMEFVVL